ncbi:hypothetical protein AB6E04_04815 [Vibrio amylolyticus]|uniref:hypothetical protein n=1 Tax=Vibrio amylolyticus TaxID=2847292 RepID=UPI00354BFB4F
MQNSEYKVRAMMPKLLVRFDQLYTEFSIILYRHHCYIKQANAFAVIVLLLAIICGLLT